ncbi:MAG: ABC transporter ATP-binding protein [Anaerolineales bacterium]|nr:ABC transporter ATP-binding protein [Anaerolineales bacterium]
MSDRNVLPSGQAKIDELEMVGIVKRFPGVLANDDIDFDVRAGEVHALLGENGAGKSTLMKILYGLYQADEGEILVSGERVEITNPTDAIAHGIGMIHQHFMLVETLTVAENVALGLKSTRGLLTDIEHVSERIDELARLYGLFVDPAAYIWQLSVGQQQRVEILKALYRGAALLILDEPTAVLTPQEVDDLFRIMRQMADDGHALIFISHKLHEVIEISQRVTVLRDGRKIGTKPTSETTKSDLGTWMVGREVSFRPIKSESEPGEVRLRLDNVSALSNRETPALKGVSLEVRSGEILGLAGVSGNGQRELAEVITGLCPVTGGSVFLEGEDVTDKSVAERTERMLSYIPEERMRDGMIRNFTVAENLILREHNKAPYARSGFLDLDQIAVHTGDLIQEYNVKTPSQETYVKSLSGGNIQKLVLARELSRQPRVIVAAQPTRGLDIGATEYVHQQLIRQRSSGAATLLISEDLDEILALSDRIAVIYEGEIMGTLDAHDATAEEIGLLMAGVRPDERSEAVG